MPLAMKYIALLFRMQGMLNLQMVADFPLLVLSPTTKFNNEHRTLNNKS
jgi:hypothetical protein